MGEGFLHCGVGEHIQVGVIELEDPRLVLLFGFGQYGQRRNKDGLERN